MFRLPDGTLAGDFDHRTTLSGIRPDEDETAVTVEYDIGPDDGEPELVSVQIDDDGSPVVLSAEQERRLCEDIYWSHHG